LSRREIVELNERLDEMTRDEIWRPKWRDLFAIFDKATLAHVLPTIVACPSIAVFGEGKDAAGKHAYK
jgi:hypothetical protein